MQATSHVTHAISIERKRETERQSRIVLIYEMRDGTACYW